MSPPSFWFIAVLLVAPLVSGCRAPALAQGVRASTAAPERTALSPSDSVLVHRLDALTRRLAAADSFSGVVLLARDGDPIYTFTTGVADRRTGAPNRLDTRFNLASVDKFFTRVAVHQLQEAGRLSTSDLVGRHLPDYPNDRVRDEVTIGHLLSMRSGMGDFDTDPDYRNYHASLPGLRSTDDYLALFADDTLLFDPGTDTAYSNAGYVVLGKVIERVSGQSYYDYVREHVFDPAGMTGTGYFTPDDDVPNLAVGYTKNPIASEAESQLAEGSVERSPNTSLLAYRGSSAGGGYSTAEDFLRLSRALLAHRLMGPEATYAMLGSRFNAPDPEAFDLDGWRGGSEGINTVFLVFSTGHTLVVLTNYDPPVATTISREFMGEWLPAWLETSRDDSSHPGSRRP